MSNTKVYPMPGYCVACSRELSDEDRANMPTFLGIPIQIMTEYCAECKKALIDKAHKMFGGTDND